LALSSLLLAFCRTCGTMPAFSDVLTMFRRVNLYLRCGGDMAYGIHHPAIRVCLHLRQRTLWLFACYDGGGSSSAIYSFRHFSAGCRIATKPACAVLDARNARLVNVVFSPTL